MLRRIGQSAPCVEPDCRIQRAAMSRKAMEPSSRRSPRRRPADAAVQARPLRKATPVPEDLLDSDFGLALALMPALRRRPDA